MNVKDTILEEAIKLFQREGIDSNTEDQLRQKLDISQATYKELFSSKEDLVRQAIEYDIAVQEEFKKNLLKKANTSVEEILILIQQGIKDMKETNPAYISDIIQHYPRVWEMCLDYLNTHSYHQIYDILNRGVQSGDFRKDINMQLVTKIMLEMATMLLNPNTFPPERFNLSEVYRSMYLYYIRGLCTDSGAKSAENYFSNLSI